MQAEGGVRLNGAPWRAELFSGDSYVEIKSYFS